MKKRAKQTHGWAIAGEAGIIYIGWWLTRADAIAAHIDALCGISERPGPNGKLTAEQTSEWEKCRRRGDRAIKVRISEVQR